MFSNISKRVLLVNSNSLCRFKQMPLPSSTSSSTMFNKFYSTNNKKVEEIPSTSTNINDDSSGSNSKESYTHMYELIKKRLDESEKAIEKGLDGDKELEFFKNRLSSKEIYLSRHGTLALVAACFIFVGTMAYFYFQKRKHLLISQQADQHTISITNELNELKNYNEKLNNSLLNNQKNQDQLINLLIDNLIVDQNSNSNNNNNSKPISNSDLNKLKSDLKSIIVNNSK